ncbi:Asp-tRNA(Asn)/Glu-tRNA(Gln) amidotransferase subunit GatC [Chryseotalea sanaruensis]|uniref:Aspartyl/glutamyl-tRNA(Asn/Gln) amidotransferase subunit C n=1 Tax=Chryseotalea sanaruensis TaxID=2482724 RepID=A0A401U9P8_9BACT|nr:Asp-tRNA(Asn)/Glu-tRNA(Gln) amidotransferase subunit GatC [Chryseotalea sanaruensis]GCC51611.1 Asp-tRNA(Asn)/Glu-tRNA(Gln) amidotransferase subunit GatC [Chryseotalea sanaruensis]
MKVDRETLDKMAHLSRLHVEEKDAEKMMEDMSNILNWVGKLNEVNTDGVEPLTNMSHEFNVMREDVVKTDISKEDALKQAPSKDADFFRVPKMLE